MAHTSRCPPKEQPPPPVLITDQRIPSTRMTEMPKWTTMKLPRFSGEDLPRPGVASGQLKRLVSGRNRGPGPGIYKPSPIAILQYNQCLNAYACECSINEKARQKQDRLNDSEAADVSEPQIYLASPFLLYFCPIIHV